MDKCREAFEKQTHLTLYIANLVFDEKDDRYIPNENLIRTFEEWEWKAFSNQAWGVNLAWWAWQSRQVELDQAYEDIETFVQAHQRECDIKVQIANELKEKNKRIEEILFVIARAKDGYYGYSKDGGDTDNLVFDLEKALGDKNANS